MDKKMKKTVKAVPLVWTKKRADYHPSYDVWQARTTNRSRRYVVEIMRRKGAPKEDARYWACYVGPAGYSSIEVGHGTQFATVADAQSAAEARWRELQAPPKRRRPRKKKTARSPFAKVFEQALQEELEVIRLAGPMLKLLGFDAQEVDKAVAETEERAKHS